MICGGECCLMWFGWGWGMMFFVPLCFIFGAVAIYYLIVSSRGNCSSYNSQRYHSSSRAVEILSERYAKGELIKEEFLEMRKELEK